MLLIIFSATLSQNSKQHANLSFRQLIVRIGDATYDGPDYFTLGRDGNLGVAVANQEGEVVNCYGPEPSASQALQVAFQEPARNPHQIRVRAPEGQQLKLIVWLSRLENPEGDIDPAQIQRVLGAAGTPIPLHVLWMGNEVGGPNLLKAPFYYLEIPLDDAG